MANRIYIQLIGDKYVFEAPLTKPVPLEMGSQFSSLGELAPALDTFLTIAKRLSVSGGTMGKSTSDFYNAFDLQFWKKTDPFKFQTTLAFYTKEDPETDVFDKMSYLMSLSILTANKKGDKVTSYDFPGLTVNNFSSLLNEQDTGGNKNSPADIQNYLNTGGNKKSQEHTAKNNSKFISVWIPGIIYLDFAMIVTCTPTFSHQKTAGGFPLWGELEVNISGLYPATSNMFDTVRTYTKPYPQIMSENVY